MKWTVRKRNGVWCVCRPDGDQVTQVLTHHAAMRIAQGLARKTGVVRLEAWERDAA